MITSEDMLGKCPLLDRRISELYCWELSNLADDEFLENQDKTKITDWTIAQSVCKKCERYNG